MNFTGKQITFMSCSSCNTKCKHCYIEYKGDFDPKVLEYLIDKFKNNYEIDINGSEPLLNEKYLEAYKIIGQKRMLTNGKILLNNQQLFDKLHKYGIEWICISHHFNIHNEISKTDLNKLPELFKQVKENGFKLEIMVTIDNSDYRNIEYMIKEAIRFKADCIRFTNLFLSGLADNNFKKRILSQQDIYEFLDLFYVCKEKYKNKIKVRRSGTFGIDGRKEKSNFYCPAGNDRIAITPDLSIYPCPFLTKPEYKIGELRDGNICIDKKFDYTKDQCCLLKWLNFNNREDK